MIKKAILKYKLKKVGIEPLSQEDDKILGVIAKISGSSDYVVKALERSKTNIVLQELIEKVYGKKDAGGYLQLEPIVIQCYTCYKNFATKKGVTFAGPTIYEKDINNIYHHIGTCEEVKE